MNSLTSFHFLRPYWIFALLPLLVVLWLYMKRRQVSGSWKAVCDPRLLPYILMGVEKRQSLWRVGLIGFAGVLTIVALAGPVWKQLPQPVFRNQSSLVIVMDLSRSMDSTDITPSRLIRARLKILDILHQRKEGQTALVVYAAEPFVVTPLTQDTNTITSLVNTLNTDLMPRQGSRSSVALKKAMTLLTQAGITHGDILLITDGVDDADTPSVIKNIVKRGSRVSILGVGTKLGAPIPADDGGFLKDAQGHIVIPKLNDAKLKMLVNLGGGLYRHISNEDSDINALSRLFNTLQVNNRLGESKNQLNVHADLWREEGPWLLLVVIPLAAMVFRRGYLLLLLALMLPVPNNAYAFGWNDLWRTPDQQGAQAFTKGKPKQAATLFRNKQWQGAAHYRSKDYKDTVKDLDGINTPDALYNKANALARLGKFQQAIASYDQALKLDPKNEDAKYNRDLLKKYLQKQNKNNKQGQKNNNSQNNSKNGKGQGQQDQKNQGKGSKQQNSEQNSQQPNKDEQQSSDQQDTDKKNATQEQKQQASTQQQKKPGDEQQAQQQKAQDEKSQQQQAQAAKEKQTNNDAEKKKGQKQGLARRNEMKKLSPEEQKKQEQQLANEQWLRRIPDDPGGLLRRKFRYQSQLNQENSDQPSESLQPW